MKSYTGMVAVVTGASSGLGRQFAVDLARRGATVVGLARRAELLDALTADLRAHTGASATHVLDVSDTDAFAAALQRVENEHGRIDVLVNSAGVERRVSAEEADLAHYRWTLETNFFAAVAGTLAVLPGMLSRSTGAVVNISSDHGRSPGPHTAAYCASKAALSAFTEAVSYEVKARGVHLHVLYPGWVATGLGQGAVDQGMPMPPRAVRRTAEQVSARTLDRIGGPRLEINAARIATLAPVAKALVPRLYQRAMVKVGG